MGHESSSTSVREVLGGFWVRWNPKPASLPPSTLHPRGASLHSTCVRPLPESGLSRHLGTMDSWRKPNESDSGSYASPAEALDPTTPQTRTYHRQERPEAYLLFPLGTTLPRHSVSPPIVIPNKPRLWQLGPHSHYTSSIEYDQQSPRPSVQPILENSPSAIPKYY